MKNFTTINIKHLNYVATSIVAIAIILLTGTFLIRNAYAESSSGLIVSPPNFISEILPETPISQVFIVTNHRGQSENITVTSREIGIDEGGAYFVPEGFENDMTSRLERDGYMTISNKSFTLNNTKSEYITVTFNLPADYDTNGYYLELAFQSEPAAPGTSKIATAPEVIIPIAINFKGVTPQQRKLGIIEFKQAGKPDISKEAVILRGFANGIERTVQVLTFDNKSQVSQYVPIKFTSLIKNEGNTNIAPKGEIFISKDKDFKEIISTIPLSSPLNSNCTDDCPTDTNNAKIVFAGSSRVFESYWKEGFIHQDEDGKVHYHFDKLDKLRIGKYYAQLTVIWDEEMGISYKTEAISFWIIPWKEIVVVTAFSLALIYAIFVYTPSLLSRIKKKV
jgi:hypothetical protein